MYVTFQKQNFINHRRHGQLRQRRAQEIPGQRHQGDPHLLARREEAGRHASQASEPQGQVLHRQRAEQAVR